MSDGSWELFLKEIKEIIKELLGWGILTGLLLKEIKEIIKEFLV